MKLFLALGVLVGLYVYVMMHTTTIVLDQTQHLNAQYQYVAEHADELATGH
jgi:hypothetical protein